MVKEYKVINDDLTIECYVKYEDYIQVVEENEYLKGENKAVMIDIDNIKRQNEELKEKLNKLKNGYNETIEENHRLEGKLISLLECKENPLAKFRPIEEWRKENIELKEKLEEMTSIANSRGEEIQQYKIITREVIKLTKFISEERNCYGRAGDSSVDVAIDTIKKLEKEIEGMKTLKVCMKCQIKEKETIDKWISKGRYLFIDNCLQEDCGVCEGENKNKFVEVIEQTNYGFEDSWMLSYKVKGMEEPIIQHHLTKEECEIIYGNMNNITYWFMEVMGND